MPEWGRFRGGLGRRGTGLSARSCPRCSFSKKVPGRLPLQGAPIPSYKRHLAGGSGVSHTGW